MEIYNLQSPAQILTSIRKTEKVMQAVNSLIIEFLCLISYRFLNYRSYYQK